MQHFKAFKIVVLSARSHFQCHVDHFQNTHFWGSTDGIFDPETDDYVVELVVGIEKKLPVLEKGREISVNFEKFLWKFLKVAKNFNSTTVH